MSYVVAAPELLSAAAADLAQIASTLEVANVAAASPTSSLLAAGADDVSAAIAAIFGAYGQAYQSLSAHAARFHDQFVWLLSGGAAQYAAAEATNTEQQLLNAINSPFLVLTGRPLIGDGVQGAPGRPGGPGGWLYGNGGDGGNAHLPNMPGATVARRG